MIYINEHMLMSWDGWGNCGLIYSSQKHLASPDFINQHMFTITRRDAQFQTLACVSDTCFLLHTMRATGLTTCAVGNGHFLSQASQFRIAVPPKQFLVLTSSKVIKSLQVDLM